MICQKHLTFRITAVGYWYSLISVWGQQESVGHSLLYMSSVTLDFHQMICLSRVDSSSTLYLLAPSCLPAAAVLCFCLILSSPITLLGLRVPPPLTINRHVPGWKSAYHPMTFWAAWPLCNQVRTETPNPILDWPKNTYLNIYIFGFSLYVDVFNLVESNWLHITSYECITELWFRLH